MSESSGETYSPSLPNLLLHAAVKPRWTAHALSQSPELNRSGWSLVLAACAATLVCEYLETRYATSIGAVMDDDELFGPVLDLFFGPIFLVVLFLLLRFVWVWPFRYGSDFNECRNFSAASLTVGLDALLAPVFTLVGLVSMWAFVRDAQAPAEAYEQYTWAYISIGLIVFLYYQTSFFRGAWQIGLGKALAVTAASVVLCALVLLVLIAVPIFGIELVSELLSEPI